MKIILSLLLFVAFVIFGVYLANNGERVTSIKDEHVVGTYIFIHNEKERYQMILNQNHSLLCKKIENNNVVSTSDGTWKLSSLYSSPFIESKLNNIGEIDCFMGKVKKNFFTKTIKIEAISMGNFHGKEDNSFFIKQSEVQH